MITVEDADQDLQAACRALTALAEAGIPPDIQELLVRGDPERGIAPGALSRAVAATLRAYRQLKD